MIDRIFFLPSYIWAYCGNPVALNHRHASVASNSVILKELGEIQSATDGSSQKERIEWFH